MTMTRSNTWVGFGANVGGMLVAAGVESMLGMMMRADGAAQTDISSTSVRLGLGVGGSAGAVILASINSPTLDYLRRQRQSGWGMTVAVPAARFPAGPHTAELLTGVRRVLAGAAGMSQAAMAARLTRDNVGRLFDYVQMALSAAQGGAAATSSAPALLAFGVPGLGGGAEASAYVTVGYVQVGSLHGGEPVALVRGLPR